MAAQPDQPISVENLSAALQKAVGEVVLYAGGGESNLACCVDEPLSAFDQFKVIASTMYGMDAPFTVPATAGTVSNPSGSVSSVTISESANGTTVRVSCNDYGGPNVYRVVGIRSGGGVALADLLAAMGGEAA